jgi:hypothetical protein
MSQKYQFVATHASEYPVTLLCRVLELARSGYYAWRKQCQSAHAQRDQQLTAQIQTIFTDSRRTYGSPRVHAELQAQGVRCARKRVARLMRRAQLCARARCRNVRTTDSRHAEPVAPNLLSRSFQADAPNRVWVADITYLPTREGWLYLAVVLDLFARRSAGQCNHHLTVAWCLPHSIMRCTAATHRPVCSTIAIEAASMPVPTIRRL